MVEVLVCIDIFSQYALAIPLKTKTAEETAAALEHMLDKMGVPKEIYTDDGFEFRGT